MFNRIRNIKKRWFVVVGAVALLSIGLVGGSVFAASATGNTLGSGLHHASGQDGNRHGKGDSSAVLARVAEIVDVEQDTLESAFKTAFDEQAETRFDDRIDALVTDETLTEGEGNAAKTWFEDRPELSGPLAIRLAGTSDSEKVDSWLAKLVENEKLTQDESDALSGWHDDRPESLPETARRHSGKHRHHGNDSDEES
ncbi:MAG: hypothetical protein J4G13_02725 [Dehalococcoidia bacterium]|nr:hypothetical protein [Dehalococcoidia bacterium]